MTVAESYRIEGGEEVHRYWVHPRILVGPRLRDAADVRHLLDAYGVTAMVNASEFDDESLGVVHLVSANQPDDGEPRLAHHVRSVVMAARRWDEGGRTVYVHCAKGMVRGPSYAYAVLRAWGWTASEAFSAVAHASPWGWAKEARARVYVDSIEAALA